MLSRGSQRTSVGSSSRARRARGARLEWSGRGVDAVRLWSRYMLGRRAAQRSTRVVSDQAVT
ncbi:unnamed protein product [Musa textilis]